MRHPFPRKHAFAVALAAPAVALGVVASGDAATPGTPEVRKSTAKNVLVAMHGEAFANAKYRAYAAQAKRSGDAGLSALFTRTARVEVGQHFAEEAALVGVVSSDAANLCDAISGENDEATRMYPRFARAARRAGDVGAAERFREIARDEARHRDDYRRALATLRVARVAVPAGKSLDPVQIPSAPSRVASATRANALEAMHGESFAYAKYTLYAAHARSTGHRAIARLFERTAQVELRQHFAEEARLVGLVGENAANLKDSISGEDGEATEMYPRFAEQAQAARDARAAALLSEIAADEARHRDDYRRALAGAGR